MSFFSKILHKSSIYPNIESFEVISSWLSMSRWEMYKVAKPSKYLVASRYSYVIQLITSFFTRWSNQCHPNGRMIDLRKSAPQNKISFGHLSPGSCPLDGCLMNTPICVAYLCDGVHRILLPIFVFNGHLKINIINDRRVLSCARAVPCDLIRDRAFDSGGLWKHVSVWFVHFVLKTVFKNHFFSNVFFCVIF